jgi:hypothetical protein
LGSKLPQDTQFVDIVIWPFFEKQIIDLLKGLTGKDWKAKYNYGNTDLNARTIWIEYAKKYWQKQ